MNYLRKLLGDAWVDAEVLGANPTHPLGRWQKSGPNNPWVPHIEGLVKFILTDKRIKFVAKDLRRKRFLGKHSCIRGPTKYRKGRPHRPVQRGYLLDLMNLGGAMYLGVLFDGFWSVALTPGK